RWRLINGKELYDLKADPGQTTDVAAANGEVVKRLRGEYEAWWKSISARFGEDCAIVLGSPHENPTTLTGHDWRAAAVPVTQEVVKKLPAMNGHWAVEVEKAGTYRFTLRHQPAEAKSVLKATKARVTVGDQEASAAVPAGATAVTLELTLKAGPAKLQ